MRTFVLTSMLYLSALSYGLPGGAHASDMGNPLSAATIEAVFPGSYKAVVWGAVKVRFTAHEGGRLTATRGDTSDSGKWDVRGGKLCITLRKWLDGKWRCSPVHQQDGWYRAGAISFRRLYPTVVASD